MFEMMKVFDCQAMSDGIREGFFDLYRDTGSIGNDCYIDWTVGDDLYIDAEYIQKAQSVDLWLIQNGAEAGEEVIIKFWW